VIPGGQSRAFLCGISFRLKHLGLLYNVTHSDLNISLGFFHQPSGYNICAGLFCRVILESKPCFRTSISYMCDRLWENQQLWFIFVMVTRL